MKGKSIISMMTALCIAGAMSGCGSSSSEEDIESKSSKTVEITYEPSEEILNAELSSGLVQIGNDIFRAGGYYTVDQFIKEFGDRYDMSELNVEGLMNKDYNENADIVSLLDPELKITVYYNGYNAEENKVRIGNAIVTSISTSQQENCWYPKGVRADGEGYDYYSIPEFYEDNGFVRGGEIENHMNYGVYWESLSHGSTDRICARGKGDEVNLYGLIPMYEYTFYYKLEDTKAYEFNCNTYSWGKISFGDLDYFTPMS